MPSLKTQPKATDIVAKVAERIRTSDNVLVALSKDPTVDELSAALGLTFILDKIGKRATAIFSGAIPNAIEFLEPEKTFEANTDSLQDFIIALDKEKADHLRYKIDGDYVKVFITPYKTTIDERDMEFSHGDYNVDLVISLDVSDAGDLDAALSEYGRIMHDATSINISAGAAGSFGDIEWGNPDASSVSEMIGALVDALKEKEDILDKSISTALLAGIVAATNRFSNERTTPDTMALASRLMAAGADQQLISSSIPVEILTEDVVDANADFAPTPAAPVAVAVAPEDAKIDIENPEQDLPVAEPAATPVVAAVAPTPAPAPAPAAPVAVAVAPEAPTAPEAPVPVEEPEEEPLIPSEPAEEPVEEPEPTPEPAKDPTELDIRHGEVEFDPDEDLSPEERAIKDAERAKEEAARQAAAEEERKRRAPIEAAMAEITAKKAAANGATPLATPAAVAQAPQAPASSIDAKNASASATAAATDKSPLISTVKGNGEAAADPKPDQAKLESARQVESALVSENQAEAELEAGLAATQTQAAPVLEELAAETKKKIMPLGDVLNRPETKVDYASIMDAELNAPAAPAPVAMPAPMAPVEAPVETPVVAAPVAPELPAAPAPLANVDAAVFVDPMTVAAEAGPVLPPPPAPYVPDASAYLPPADGQAMPAPAINFDPSTADLSAAQIVDGIQAENPAVANTPLMDAGTGGYLVDPNANAAADAPVMPATDAGYIVGAEPAPAPEAPADPSAFVIPGM